MAELEKASIDLSDLESTNSDEYVGTYRVASNRKPNKRVKHDDENELLDLPPDLRTSTRLAKKTANYQFLSSSDDEYNHTPAYTTAEATAEGPSIDTVLTYKLDAERRK